MLDGVHCDRGCPHYVFALNILELKDCFVLAVESWLIQLGDTEILLGAIWLWHFEASINLSNCWYVIGNEGLQLGVEVELLWLVPLDVLEQVLDVLGHLQVGVLSWVVCSWHLLVVFAIVVIFGSLLLLLVRNIGLLLRALCLGLSLILLLILCAASDIVHVDLIILFV